ncbi:MAG: 3-deoxy-D-manno-octulosonic acid transferase [Proteobacteria bacterium]|nr:MAG: 3-deoxy-D-manno-octulosonic acid transferase [Pseudomonadota bacterium]
MLYLYRTLWILLAPVVDIWFLARLYKGKEDKKRFMERLGGYKQQRPTGKLVWFHAASVGESLSILPLIEQLLNNHKELNVLVTTGTVTSASLMQKRLPKGAIHQYVPIDFYFAVKSFMEHWQPNLSVFVESELWPELISQAPNPIIINGRMSNRSAKRYAKHKNLTGFLFNRIQLILAQSEDSYENFKQVCDTPVENSGNLKFDAPTATFDQESMDKISQILETRKILVCASTHQGEEEVMAALHEKMKKEIPELITIIAPRHPNRGKSIQNTLKTKGFNCTLRSEGEAPENIYIADTLGEMGLWYNLAHVVLMGKSLFSGGGQTPFEPLKCGRVTVCGPSMENFKEMMHIFKEREIILQSENMADIEKDLVYFLKNDKQRTLAEKKIREKMQNLGGATAETLNRIEDFLSSI